MLLLSGWGLRRRVVLTFCLGLLAATVRSQELDSQQLAFLRAETALKSGKLQVLADEEKSLQDYPLLPYLQATALALQLGKEKETAIAAFLDAHDNAPFANDLRSNWLQWLAKQNDANSFLSFYRQSGNLELQCRYHEFSLSMNKDQKTLDEFGHLWMSAQTLPDACDPAEKIWTERKQRTAERIYQRLELAIDAGNTALVNNLKKQLSVNDAKSLETWLKLHQQPELLLKGPAFPSMGPLPDLALADTLERLIWRNREQGLTAWEIQDADHLLPAPLHERVTYTYALALSTSAHDLAKSWLEKVPVNAVDERIASWRVVNAMRRLQWDESDFWLAKVPDANKTDSKFRYFRARNLDLKGDRPGAEVQFKDLSNRLDYYGYLARAQLKAGTALGPQPLNIDPAVMTKVRHLPAIMRARALLDLGREQQARREWYFLTRHLSVAELQAIAVVANEWQWTDRAVVALKQSETTGAWDLQFPFANKDLMQMETIKRGVDLSWAYAITRQESLFVADIKSKAGAVGLMQLMPETAKIVAKKFKLDYASVRDLTRPDTNISLGVAYLSELMDRNNGNLVYATAAYNAGQLRVDRWKERDGKLPLDLWIETIPFRETQGYVKNVVSFSLIYANRLTQPATLFGQVVPDTSKAPVAAAVSTPTAMAKP